MEIISYMEQTDWLARCCLFSCAPNSLRLNQCTWKRVSLRRVTVKGYGGVTADKGKEDDFPAGCYGWRTSGAPLTQGFYPSAWECWKAMATSGVNSWKKSLQNWRIKKITTILIWRVEKIPCSERFRELNLLSSSKRGLRGDLITGTSIFMGKAYIAF